MNNRDEYVNKMKAKLDQWNADIEKLEAQAKEAGADMRIEHEQEIKALKAQRDEAAKKLEELQSAGEDAWQDIKSGAESAWDSLDSALNSATKRFQ
ncbi:hypothetical protein Q9L42_001045 [Methylomarinum sp. Ch1-1]|uniref:Coiled coil domain-containing protein n=1 Tax=Methylomarinum roseum TaxID=3067653 RepID=A0AAU7NV00_9GAMM|nr:hypothetical protein [Methylomarinum sp. Ch1-1]MDP4519159.1 hypothetical protein [Methylomarinum sp. Ch1-1]